MTPQTATPGVAVPGAPPVGTGPEFSGIPAIEQTSTIFLRPAPAAPPTLAPSSLPGARILVVDDEPSIHRILDKLLGAGHYTVVHAFNGEEALAVMQKTPPDVVLCDMRMPVMDGVELCRRIKANPQMALTPVLMLSSMASTEEKVFGLDSGADEYLTKPFQKVEVMARLRAMLRMRFLQDQLENAEQVIFTLARAVEAKDVYTAGHIERVSSLAVAIAQKQGFDANERAQLHRGGILHDIGKIGVPDSILNKPGKLTPEEFDQIKKHADVGERICRSLKTLQPVLDLIRHHHERLNGSGYPDGLSGKDVTLPARIMAVCDVYDALTSNRPYRKAMTRPEAFEVLDQGVRDGHWDRDVVNCLRSMITH